MSAGYLEFRMYSEKHSLNHQLPNSHSKLRALKYLLDLVVLTQPIYCKGSCGRKWKSVTMQITLKSFVLVVI